MNDIRRTILWVIFGFSLVLLWDQWQVHNGNKATFFPQSKPAATAEAPAGASSVPQAVPSASSAAVPAAATAAAAPGAVVPAPATAPAPASQKIVVSTDVLKL